MSVTAHILHVAKTRSLKGVHDEPSAEGLRAAEHYWIKEVQRPLNPGWEKKFERLGPKLGEEEVIVVGTRISKWMKENWNCNEFILLTANHHFTKLYLSMIHKDNHAGVEACLAKVQLKFWIPGARKILKSLKRQCYVP